MVFAWKKAHRFEASMWLASALVCEPLPRVSAKARTRARTAMKRATFLLEGSTCTWASDISVSPLSPDTWILAQRYGEVRAVPMFPTATSFVPDQATPVRLFAVPEARRDHVAPSGEVRIVPGVPPEPPTATNSVPVQAMANGKADVPED